MSSRHAAPRGPRRTLVVVTTVVVVLAVVVGAWLFTRGGSDGTDEATSDEASSAAPTTATAATPEGSPTPSEEVPDEPEATQPSGTAGPGDGGASSGDEDPTAASLAGTWSTEDNFWVLRLAADGSFEEDFDGVENVRSGTFTLEGSTFTLVGGDGNDNAGRLEGRNNNKLVFGEDVLRRRS